jgi:hypothetical protein
MAAPPTMLELDLSGHLMRLEVQRVSEIQSRHTGKPLVQLHGTASVSTQQEHQQLCKLLEAASGFRVRSVELFDERIRTWRLSWNAYLEKGGEHWYTLILQEEEELLLQELVIGDVRLFPYEYREVFTGDELTIQAKLVGTKSEILRLRALLKHHSSFPVVRRGISEEPREMRFGVAEWSEHDARIKVRVILVDRSTVLSDHPELSRIDEQNSRSAAMFYMNFAEGLAALLEAKGILSAQEIEGVRAMARDTLWQARREFWRVPNVDLL